MPRVKDVDNFAPDDPIIANSTPVSTPVSSPISPPITPDIPIADKVYSIFGHTKHSFSSSLVMPKVLTFAEKNEDEIILIALRSHWFTNVSWIITSIIMFFVPTIFKYIPTQLFTGNLQIIIFLSWYIMIFAYSFEQFLSWYFDLYLITNHRVVDIDFNNLLDKKFSEADLSKIQDVTSRVSGVSQTFFNYGTVLIQTAAEKNVIVFDKVPQPDKVVKVLQDLRHLAENNDVPNGGLE